MISVTAVAPRPLWHDIYILTTSESCVSVNGFSIANGNHCVDNSTYHKNCYLLFICLAMTRIQLLSLFEFA